MVNNLKSISETMIRELPDRYRTHLINSLSGFKSANLVGTINANKTTNLAMISSVFHLGANPPLLGFIIRPDVARRDTLENLRENGQLTINHVHEDILVQGHHASARFPQEISEFEACGLSPQFCDGFNAPFVAQSRIKIAAELLREVKIEENGTSLIIAKIRHLHLPEDCLEADGHLDLNKAGSLCVAGLDTYYSTERIGRLEYAKPHKKPDWVKD